MQQDLEKQDFFVLCCTGSISPLSHIYMIEKLYGTNWCIEYDEPENSEVLPFNVILFYKLSQSGGRILCSMTAGPKLKAQAFVFFYILLQKLFTCVTLCHSIWFITEPGLQEFTWAKTGPFIQIISQLISFKWTQINVFWRMLENFSKSHFYHLPAQKVGDNVDLLPAHSLNDPQMGLF